MFKIKIKLSFEYRGNTYFNMQTKRIRIIKFYLFALTQNINIKCSCKFNHIALRVLIVEKLPTINNI